MRLRPFYVGYISLWYLLCAAAKTDHTHFHRGRRQPTQWNLCSDAQLGNELREHFCMTPPWLSCHDIAFYAELSSRITSTGGCTEKTLLIEFLSTAKQTGWAWRWILMAGTLSLKIFKATCKYDLGNSVFIIIIIIIFCKLMYSILLRSLGWWPQSHRMCSLTRLFSLCVRVYACLTCLCESSVWLSVCSLFRFIGLSRLPIGHKPLCERVSPPILLFDTFLSTIGIDQRVHLQSLFVSLKGNVVPVHLFAIWYDMPIF